MNISLRPFDGVDIEFFCSLAADPRIMRYISDGAPWTAQKSTDRAYDAIQSPSTSWFTAHDGAMSCGLFTVRFDAAPPEIGYWLHPDYWGRGVAKTVVAQGIEVLHMTGVYDLSARVHADNIGSIRILEGQGFEPVGPAVNDGLRRFVLNGSRD